MVELNLAIAFEDPAQVLHQPQVFAELLAQLLEADALDPASLSGSSPRM